MEHPDLRVFSIGEARAFAREARLPMGIGSVVLGPPDESINWNDPSFLNTMREHSRTLLCLMLLPEERPIAEIKPAKGELSKPSRRVLDNVGGVLSGIRTKTDDLLRSVFEVQHEQPVAYPAYRWIKRGAQRSALRHREKIIGESKAHLMNIDNVRRMTHGGAHMTVCVRAFDGNQLDDDEADDFLHKLGSLEQEMDPAFQYVDLNLQIARLKYGRYFQPAPPPEQNP